MKEDEDRIPGNWRKQAINFPGTAFDMIAECIRLRYCKEIIHEDNEGTQLKVRVYTDSAGKHYVQTKFGFQPESVFNEFLKNQDLQKELDKERNTNGVDGKAE